MIQQKFPDAARLCFLRNKNALDVFAVQTEKALYPLIRFIHIDFRLRQHLFHGSEIALPVGRGNKSVRLAIGVQPDIRNAVDVCFLQWSNHDDLSENPILCAARRSVPRLPEDQPAGRRCRPGGGAVARGENVRHRAGVPLPESDLQQRAGEDAHHVVQKAVARECQAHFLAQPLDGDGIDRAHGRFFHAPVGTERRAFMRAAQRRCRALHGRRVERLRQGVDIAALEHVRRLAVPDAVDIRLAAAGQSRVKARRGFLEREHADVPRQARTQLPQQLRRGQVRFRAERRRLYPGVHARVRAAGARDLDRLRQQVAECGLEPPLNGVRRVALPLPAVVARAVIAERHAKIRHGAPPLDER